MGRRRRQSRLLVHRLLGGVAVVWALAMLALSSSAFAEWFSDWVRLGVGLCLFAGIAWVIGRTATTAVFWPSEHRRSIARRRVRAGRCPQCEYDLRVWTDRCPECGWTRPLPVDVHAHRLRQMVQPDDDHPSS